MTRRSTAKTIDDPDLDEFRVAQQRSTPCKVARSVTKLDEADSRKVSKALAHIDVRHQAIADFFIHRGLHLSAGSVADHRKGRCSCHRHR